MKNTHNIKKTFYNLNLSKKQNLFKFKLFNPSSLLLQNEKKQLKQIIKPIVHWNRSVSTPLPYTETQNDGVKNRNNFNKHATRINLNKLNPWLITGFIDGEGSFTVSKTGISVKLELKVTQKEHSEKILHQIKEYFNCGSVVIDNRKTKTMKYRVSSLNDILTQIIPHLDKYPCLTSKFLNYQDWKKIAIKMMKKEHLTLAGLNDINLIITKMNKGRLFEDKYNHCKISLGLTSNGEITKDLPADWVQAFIDGEGSFYNYIATSKSKSKGKIYNLQRCDSSLEIGQNNHDVLVLLAIKKFFGGGYVKPKYNYSDIVECKNSRSLNRFVFRDTASIIQFLDNHPMLTRKQLDYLDWKKIVELKNIGAHKTVEGLNLIKNIISQMNSTRSSN